jgi:hypothetical protein
MCFGSDFALY